MKECGLIEAEELMRTRMSKLRFPHLKECGLIEAKSTGALFVEEISLSALERVRPH